MEDAVQISLAERNETDGADDEFREIVRRQLELLGEDPDREGLKRTPQRVATALAWLTRGYEMDVEHVVNGALFDAEGATNMIMVRDIELYSLCEHHMLPFFGRAHIAYIPNGSIVGLSKLPRIVEVFAAASGPGAFNRTNRQRAPRCAQANGSRGGDRGVSPLHDDARRGEAELEDDHHRATRKHQKPPTDAREVPDVGVCAPRRQVTVE